jgi:hypothetical protein
MAVSRKEGNEFAGNSNSTVSQLKWAAVRTKAVFVSSQKSLNYKQFSSPQIVTEFSTEFSYEAFRPTPSFRFFAYCTRLFHLASMDFYTALRIRYD